MTTILDGKKLSEEIIKKSASEFSKNTRLATILVGDNYASELYLKIKEKRCRSAGIDFILSRFKKDAGEDVVIEKIKDLNQDEDVTGILVQLPLPENLDSWKILDSIKPEKDVDGLTSRNLGLLMSRKETLVSCTPKGVIRLLEAYDISLKGKHAVIVNHSFLVGRPLAQLFLNRDATVTVCHEYTRNLKEITRQADILVSATGMPGLIKKDMIKENAVVVDVGISRKDGRLAGDVDFEDVKERCSHITPVPGGVGPMTVAMLIENLAIAHRMRSSS